LLINFLKVTKAKIPWWMKVCVKLVLSRLPFEYRFWQMVGVFSHGKMNDLGYVQSVFDHHILAANLKKKLLGKTLLELGPGDSIATAVISACHGARAILVDAGDYAVKRVGPYQVFANNLREQGLNPPDFSEARTREDILAICGARYFVNGLHSLKAISDGSIDFIFSQAVLEHVRRDEFFEIMKELYRILSSDGLISHRVDLKDHLGGELNNLRFNETVWESDFFSKSGFYTNRIRFSLMIEMFEDAGFYIESIQCERWAVSPIRRRSLSRDFSLISDDDLLVKGFDVLMRPL
jgi:SAM-dependent methyltransferase